MTDIDRRSLLKITAATCIASACAPGSTNAPAVAPAAKLLDTSFGSEFGMQFSGLIACVYSKTNNKVTMALPDAPGHSAYVTADLRFVDPNSSGFDFVVPGPGGQHLGVWKVKTKGEIQLTNVAGTTIVPTPATDPAVCPGDDPVKWQSVSWVADVSKILGQKVTLDETLTRALLRLKGGLVGAVMPADPAARVLNYVCVDDGDADVTQDGKHIINQPLAGGLFYRGTMLGDLAVLALPDGTAIKMKGVSAGGFQAILAHLPDAFDKSSRKRRLAHFDHYYKMLKPAVGKRYPGVAGGCGSTAVRSTTMAMLPDLLGSDGPPNIEPIYCPPAYVAEP